MCAQPQKCFTLCIFLCSYVVAECSQTLGCSQTSGECTSTGTSPYLNNSPFISSHLSHFIKQKYFHGNMGTNTIGGAPRHNALGFFCRGRSLKIHREIKREFLTLSGSPNVGGSLKTYSSNLVQKFYYYLTKVFNPIDLLNVFN